MTRSNKRPKSFSNSSAPSSYLMHPLRRVSILLCLLAFTPSALAFEYHFRQLENSTSSEAPPADSLSSLQSSTTEYMQKSSGDYVQPSSGDYAQASSGDDAKPSPSPGSKPKPSNAQPSSGDYAQPSSGDDPQPSSSNSGSKPSYMQPSSGDTKPSNKKPSEGDYVQPSSGDYAQKSSGDYAQGSSGDYAQGSSGDYAQGSSGDDAKHSSSSSSGSNPSNSGTGGDDSSSGSSTGTGGDDSSSGSSTGTGGDDSSLGSATGTKGDDSSSTSIAGLPAGLPTGTGQDSQGGSSSSGGTSVAKSLIGNKEGQLVPIKAFNILTTTSRNLAGDNKARNLVVDRYKFARATDNYLTTFLSKEIHPSMKFQRTFLELFYTDGRSFAFDGAALYNTTSSIDENMHNKLVEKYLTDEKALYLNFLRLSGLSVEDAMFCWAEQHCSSMPNPNDVAAASTSSAHRATWRQCILGVVPVWAVLFFIL